MPRTSTSQKNTVPCLNNTSIYLLKNLRLLYPPPIPLFSSLNVFFRALLYMFPLSTIVKFTVLNIFSGFFWFFQCLGGDCYVSTGTWVNLSGITATLPINNVVI
ncbi:hypothetical protein BJY52DRAFT_1314211 [Lactarius psammicola]|nr:hypothetical protein BJY52DRAFT_1314211 [Lactarius psammicola]